MAKTNKLVINFDSNPKTQNQLKFLSSLYDEGISREQIAIEAIAHFYDTKRPEIEKLISDASGE